MASDQEASSSNSTERTWKYDVFLSFRGKDTRKGFTDHLYHALVDCGFSVFRDDEGLERGEVISDALLQAIKDSLFAVVVLSKNYASSSWCLNELQYILDSRSNPDQKVFPIFYDVDPSHVRHQTESFAEAFAKYRERGRENEVMKSWQDSLTKVAGFSGWHSKDQHEAKLIKTVVKELWAKLRDRLPPYTEGLIGINNKVRQLESLLEIGLKDVRFVGIWGLAGVGKTTLARAIFEKYRSQFDISCFLHNVRATSLERDGMVQLQSKVLQKLKNDDIYEGKKVISNCLRNKRVLLFLDDVSHTSQLENLANSPDWFGAGSRVVITTRDNDLLCKWEKVYVHEVETMGLDESLQLFGQKAFGSGGAPENLLEMSKSVCDYAKGLPLALSVLGSLFRGKNGVQQWEDFLTTFKKSPPQDILSTLKPSYDMLTNIEEKAIFLDIACFFNGWRKKGIIRILESCGFNAKIGIATLQEKSMLKEYDDCLVMHDLLQQMGESIVQQDSPYDIANRSRLWSKEDIDEVMENKLGTEKIQCVVSYFSNASWHPEAFSALRNLRLLIVVGSNLPKGLKCLPHTLKVLHWNNYPLDTLPPGSRLHKLVDLKMQDSKLKKLWDKSHGSKNLKLLDLSLCTNLIETPDLSELPNLERLHLVYCKALVELHSSIGQHTKLQVLNLKGCESLKHWGIAKLEMTSLKEFVIHGCIKVTRLPEFGESMKNLEKLDASETNLDTLPDSLGLLIGLKILILEGCKKLGWLPQSFYNLKCLESIAIRGCSVLTNFSKEEREALVDDARWHALRSGHDNAHLYWGEGDYLILKILDLPYFRHLIETPDLSKFPNLEKLNLGHWGPRVKLHSSVGQHTKLQVLNLEGCENLTHWGIGKLEMTSLKEFVIRGCIKVTRLPEFGENMKNLERLDVSETNLVKLPDSIGLLIGLQALVLDGCKNLVCLPERIYNFKCLSISTHGCSKLTRSPKRTREMKVLEELDAGETSHLSAYDDAHLSRSMARIRGGRSSGDERVGTTPANIP